MPVLDTAGIQPAAEHSSPSCVPRRKETRLVLSEGPSTVGWYATICWCSGVLLWYSCLQALVVAVVPGDGTQVKLPKWYEYSEVAFAVATCLNLMNLIFEDTQDKKQLALLTAVIKGISWHCDHLIKTGLAPIKLDAHGALLITSRYVQWSCSTPTMIFTLWRISNRTPREVVATLLADWAMVVTGYLACEMPWHWAWLPLLVSFFCFAYVMYQLSSMLHDAMEEAATQHARNCLRTSLWNTIIVWNLFWVAWVAEHSPWPQLAIVGEAMNLVANLGAKVLFSTSIMYNNYISVTEQRRVAQLEQEHRERIQAVTDLSAAVRRKDRFLAVVGHELRAPLQAIMQLSSALASGAAGRLGDQVAREWLDTVAGSAKHLLAVVNDVVLFRASQAASIPLVQEVVDVAGVVDEVLRTLLPSTANTGLLLEKVVHARLPPIIGDRRRLVHALSNLVGNAIKFTGNKPGGRVSVKAYPDKGGRHVVLKVVDNGCGLSPAQLAQLAASTGHQVVLDAVEDSSADRGRKGAPGAGRRAGGLGLGLAITHQLAAAHGGQCRLSSPGPDAGVAAVLWLPVLQRATDEPLQESFTALYEALGFSTEQLLSPELARIEARVCPRFVCPRPSKEVDEAALYSSTKTARRSSGVHPTLMRWGGSVASRASAVMHNGASKPSLDQSQALAKSYMGRRTSGRRSMSSVDSTGSAPVVAAYRWPYILGAHGASVPAAPAVAAPAATAVTYGRAQMTSRGSRQGGSEGSAHGYGGARRSRGSAVMGHKSSMDGLGSSLIGSACTLLTAGDGSLGVASAGDRVSLEHRPDWEVANGRLSWEAAAGDRASWEAAGVGYNCNQDKGWATSDHCNTAQGGDAPDAPNVAPRPSEDSLARWEAYAEAMGYTTPGLDEGLPSQPEGNEEVSQEQPRLAISTTNSTPLYQQATRPGLLYGGSQDGEDELAVMMRNSADVFAAAAARGAPGMAVALSSNLYANALVGPGSQTAFNMHNNRHSMSSARNSGVGARGNRLGKAGSAPLFGTHLSELCLVEGCTEGSTEGESGEEPEEIFLTRSSLLLTSVPQHPVDAGRGGVGCHTQDSSSSVAHVSTYTQSSMTDSSAHSHGQGQDPPSQSTHKAKQLPPSPLVPLQPAGGRPSIDMFLYNPSGHPLVIPAVAHHVHPAAAHHPDFSLHVDKHASLAPKASPPADTQPMHKLNEAVAAAGMLLGRRSQTIKGLDTCTAGRMGPGDRDYERLPAYVGMPAPCPPPPSEHHAAPMSSPPGPGRGWMCQDGKDWQAWRAGVDTSNT